MIGEKIFKIVLDRLSQLLGESVNPKSLGIVPLLYTYSHQGNYSKNLLYGLVYWLFSGSDEDVQTKKIALSANRGRFEGILFRCKADITAIARKGGGFKTTKDIANTIAEIVDTLLSIGEKTDAEAVEIVMKRLDFKQTAPSVTAGRTATLRQRSQINIDSLLTNAVRCPICNGLINLASGKQYDHHFKTFSEVRRTSTDNMLPTHPFCNNMRGAIFKQKGTASNMVVPQLPTTPQDVLADNRKMTLFWECW